MRINPDSNIGEYGRGSARNIPTYLGFLVLLLAGAGSGCARSVRSPARLLLGSSVLPETRAVATLAPGVTLTTINRGSASGDEHWTLQVMIPVSQNSMSTIASHDQAAQVAARLKKEGFNPVLREERNPGYKDLAPGTLGFSVRAGNYATQDESKPDAGRLLGMGYRTSPVFTGEDGDPTGGPWSIRVLTIDPRIYRGELRATHGTSTGTRGKVTELARKAGALAAVNAGFFVVVPSDGTPGEPAGLYIDQGKILSEATNGRITLNIFNRNTPKEKTYIRFQPLTTDVRLFVGELSHRLDGINRKPGVIRNCGGVEDSPTNLPVHDFTCTDADELVVITPEFGAPAPSGDGIEAAIDSNGTVTEIRARRGGAIPSGGLLVQGTGAEADWVKSHVLAGAHLRVEATVNDMQGRPVKFDSNDYAVNGGPGLVLDGKPDIRPVADGLVHSDDPSFLSRWGVRRNPRTMAGIDAQNRIMLVTVDGHQPGYSLGLSLIEGAQLMISLGAIDAMNLDGGGSTTMVVNGKLAGSPSDPTGERPVGDAIILK